MRRNVKKVARILGIMVILLVIVVVVGIWFLKKSFGPVERMVKIPVTSSQTLVCDETYIADFAAVFFDVGFKLITKEKTINLGQATFSNDQRYKQIKLDSVNGCYFLSFYEDSCLRLLLGSRATSMTMDTTLLPVYLKRDQTWRNENRDIKTRKMTSVNSKVEKITPTFLTVNYEFMIEDSLRFKQSVIYEIDSLTGRLKTREVLIKERVND